VKVPWPVTWPRTLSHVRLPVRGCVCGCRGEWVPDINISLCFPFPLPRLCKRKGGWPEFRPSPEPRHGFLSIAHAHAHAHASLAKTLLSFLVQFNSLKCLSIAPFGTRPPSIPGGQRHCARIKTKFPISNLSNHAPYRPSDSRLHCKPCMVWRRMICLPYRHPIFLLIDSDNSILLSTDSEGGMREAVA